MKIVYTIDEITEFRHQPLEMLARTGPMKRIFGALAVLFTATYPVRLKKKKKWKRVTVD